MIPSNFLGFGRAGPLTEVDGIIYKSQVTICPFHKNGVCWRYFWVDKSKKSIIRAESSVVLLAGNLKTWHLNKSYRSLASANMPYKRSVSTHVLCNEDDSVPRKRSYRHITRPSCQFHAVSQSSEPAQLSFLRAIGAERIYVKGNAYSNAQKLCPKAFMNKDVKHDVSCPCPFLNYMIHEHPNNCW